MLSKIFLRQPYFSRYFHDDAKYDRRIVHTHTGYLEAYFCEVCGRSFEIALLLEAAWYFANRSGFFFYFFSYSRWPILMFSFVSCTAMLVENENGRLYRSATAIFHSLFVLLYDRYSRTIKTSVITEKSSTVSRVAEARGSLKSTPPREWCTPNVALKLDRNTRWWWVE